MAGGTQSPNISSNAQLGANVVKAANINDGEIANADIAAGAAIDDTKLAIINEPGKVDGAALTGLANIPAGAGLIPAANITAPPSYEIRIPFIGTAHNPADGATVILPTTATIPSSSFSANDERGRIYVTKAGSIKGALFHASQGGTFGSNETFTLKVRVNNTTDYDLIPNCTINGYNCVYTASGLNIAVAAGDLLEVFYTAPTWATNPLTVKYSFALYIG